MKIPRFYQKGNFQAGDKLALSTVNHRHAIQVLRLKVEDSLILFNGEGGEYHAHIIYLDKRNSQVLLKSYNEVNRESPLTTILALATIKPDKMDFAIQKAVELGVTRIQPMYSKHSVIKIKANRLERKMQHWRAVIISACEQSGRTFIPTLEEPLTLEVSLQRYQASTCIGMLPTTKHKFSDLNRLDIDKGVALFIGPEGGFTEAEEKLMRIHQVNSVNFGSRILRAETAVIAGLTACQQQWGDL